MDCSKQTFRELTKGGDVRATIAVKAMLKVTDKSSSLAQAQPDLTMTILGGTFTNVVG